MIYHRVIAASLLLGACVSLGVSSAGTGSGAEQPGGAGSPGGVESSPKDPSIPRVFWKVVLYLKDHYADPAELRPREMLLSALESVTKVVPGVKVEIGADQSKATVAAGEATRTFDIGSVDKLWQMAFVFRDIFGFIRENISPPDGGREVEHAAINGMLCTLDRRTVFLSPAARQKRKPTSEPPVRAESYRPRLLDGGVGYVRVWEFGRDTTGDLRTVLQRMRREAESSGGLKGLVLDLRGNPGGLLEQAVQVSDLFVSSGVILTNEGKSEQFRQEHKARPDDDDLTCPVVVLVNAASGAASEIVAGALKNLNRAVIIGQRTAGHGTTRVVYEFPDGGALVLSVARWLAPGGVSFDVVGITPDIELTPVRVVGTQTEVVVPRRAVVEEDMDPCINNSRSDRPVAAHDEVPKQERPSSVLKYLLDDSKRTATPPSAKRQDEVTRDFEILFARDYLSSAPFADRSKMLASGGAFVEKRQKEEDKRINAAVGAR